MTLVEELENSVDIVEIVSKYVKLKKAGSNYKALCPFPGHNEKTPSFIVSPAKQLAYCFGCHRGWWALKFIMDIENIEFKEAISILARFAGKEIKTTNFDSEKYKIQKDIYSLYKDSVNYYKKALLNNPEAQKYLFDRGLTKEAIEKFYFWFSDSWLWLYNYLKEKWYNDELIKKSNIFVNLAQRRDKFIWRIIFPIRNLRWDFVAFTARILNTWEPKYLNSPASEFYNKSEILYLLFEAKKEILNKNFVIIVEGQMDAISMHLAWYSNTVAVSGTALTEKHLNILKRLTSKIYLCFDWDEAWKKATKLALETIKNKWFELKIINLQNWEDPDEILKKKKNFDEYIKNALNPISYLIENSNFDLNSIEDKKKILKELLETIKTYTDLVERDFYLKEVAKKLDIKEDIVYENFKRVLWRNIRFEAENKIQKKDFLLEDMAIAYILLDEKNREILQEKIIFKDYMSSYFKEFLEGNKKIESFELNKKNEIKALEMKLELELQDDTEEHKQIIFDKFIKNLNIYYYKKAVSKLKEKMNLQDEEAFKAYSELIKLAKENNIK